VQQLHCSASEQHARTFSPERSVFDVRIHQSALVLGSRQTPELVDADACVRENIEIVRRRSGGGVVFLVPGEHVWLDIVIPRTDELWVDDVASSMWWLGEVWVRALADIGIDGAQVHRGKLLNDAWGELVCFAGVGPGEVIVSATGSKVVGISQRRTRDYASFQCTVFHEWAPEQLSPLLRNLPGLPAQIEERVAIVSAGTDAVVDAVVNQMQLSPLLP
jgi:lipoate-protein ligase A